MEVPPPQPPMSSYVPALNRAQEEMTNPGDATIDDETEHILIINALDNGDALDEDENDDAPADDSDDAPGAEGPPMMRELEPMSESFRDISLFNMSEDGPSVQRPVYNPDRNKLKKLQLFKSKEHLVQACQKFCIRNRKEMRAVTSNKTRYEVVCKFRESSGCLWRVSGHVRAKLNNMWEIHKIHDNHSCLQTLLTNNNKQLTAKFICKEVYPLVQSDPSLKISTIVALMDDRYNCKMQYYKCWNAKQKAIAQIYGDWESSYKILPKFLLAIQKFNPGTVVVFETLEGDTVHEAVFDRVFWSFKASIDGFEYCRPVLSIDATHLYGKYKGNLLISLGKDANGQIYPLAFAIVDKESTRNWGWFLKNLRMHVVKGRKGLCLISDRHKGIISAINNDMYGWGRQFEVVHRFCLRHVQSNFNEKFKNADLKLLCWTAGVATNPDKFDAIMEQIGGMNPLALAWLKKISPEQWTLAHDDGYRFGETTTNASECFNGVLKSARFLPVTACVQLIFFKLVEYHYDRRKKGVEWLQSGQKFTPATIALLLSRQNQSVNHQVTKYNHTTSEASVITPGGSIFKLVLSERTCDCRKWEAFQFPCSHAIAVCREYAIDHAIFVTNWFAATTFHRAWLPELHPVMHEQHWDEWDGPTWIPNNELIRKRGRPKASRYTNEMDIETVPARNMNHCGLCREPGHDQRRCPSRIATNAPSRRV